MAMVDTPTERGGDREGVVVLVGRRRNARAAVRRLGLELLELETEPLSSTGSVGSATRAQDLLGAVADALGSARPAAVLATTEAAVPMAALLRESYGLGGLDHRAALCCSDKIVMKRTVAAAGVPCAPWVAVEEGTTVDEVVERLGLPVVLKIPMSSGGRGVTIARSREEVGRHLRTGQLAESFVDGVEMSVESLFSGGAPILRNPTRYLEARWANVLPAALQPQELHVVETLVDAAHAALGVASGMTHMELFLTRKGPVFGELAARPPGGHLMELIERAYGFDPWRALIEVALGTQPVVPGPATRYAGVWLLHPGAGEIEWVQGVDEARRMPGVQRVRIAAQPGDRVPERLGSGQSIGEVVVEADDHDTCADRLRRAVASIDIKLRQARQWT